MTITSSTIPWTISDRSAVRTGDDVRALPLALKSEWIKLASLRANKVILALAAVVGAFTAWALATSATDEALAASELFIYPLPLVAMLATVTGILMFTAEHQHIVVGAIIIAVGYVILRFLIASTAEVGSMLPGATDAAGRRVLDARTQMPVDSWVCSTCRSVNTPTATLCYRGCGPKTDLARALSDAPRVAANDEDGPRD